MTSTLPFRYPDKPRSTGVDTVRGLSSPSWLAQTKLDGWRMTVCVDGANTVRFLSRVGNPLAKKVKLPDNLSDHIVRLDLPDGTILDTEFVGPRGNLPPTVYIFDCLAFDGKWLCNVPYEQRWQHCLNLGPMLDESVPVRLTTTLFGNDLIGTDASEITRISTKMQSGRSFIQLFECLKEEWLGAGKPKKWLYEGIVVKRCAGTLLLDRNSNKKSQHMFKLRFREIGETRY